MAAIFLPPCRLAGSGAEEAGCCFPAFSQHRERWLQCCSLGHPKFWGQQSFSLYVSIIFYPTLLLRLSEHQYMVLPSCVHTRNSPIRSFRLRERVAGPRSPNERRSEPKSPSS